MPEELRVGDTSAEPGERAEGWIRGVELTTGHSIDVPVLTVNGAEDGPTLLLFSMQHGIELQNVGIVHDVMHERLDPESVAGQVIAIPVANPLAYMHATYRSWIDNGDLGYDSTRQPEGTPSERLTNAVWEEAWSQSDMVLNMHANTRPDSLFYQGIKVTPETIETQERMARAHGLTTIRYEGLDTGPGTVRVDAGDLPPTLENRAAADGIAVMTTETVDSRWITEPSQKVGIDGVLNLMREFEMLDGEAVPGHELQRENGVEIVDCEYTGGSGVNRSLGMIRPDHGGIFHPKKRPGEFIEEGEVLAEVVDMHGNLVEAVEMPQDGYVWAYPGSQTFEVSGALQTVESGGWLAFGFTHEDEYSDSVVTDA